MKQKKQRTPESKRSRLTANRQGSGQVFSYYSSRTPRGSQQRVDRRDVSSGRTSKKIVSRLKWRHVPMVLSILVVLAAFIYNSTVNSRPVVIAHGLKPGMASVLQLHSINEYEIGAQTIINGSSWDSFKFTFDQSFFVKQLMSQYPEIAIADVTLPILGHRPVVDVGFNVPSFVLVTNDGSYVVDQNGKVIAPVAAVKRLKSLHLQTVQDQSGLKVVVGKSILSDKQTTFLRTVAYELTAQQIRIQSIVLPAVPNELDIRIHGKPYTVKFNMLLDGRQSAGTYLAVKTSLDKDHITPGKYIDVRVEGRAYYK